MRAPPVPSHLHPMRILSAATAVPEHRIEQPQARELARMMFQEAFSDLDRLLHIFENAKIDSRHTARPLSWFDKPHTFPESNQVYVECAQDISEAAAREAMKRAGVSAEQIQTIVFVSSTGIATPSLDSKLIQRLGLSSSTARIPVWGLGCAGGVAGLARATDIARSRPGITLFIATELCSLTFQRNDMSRSNLVATGLFGDGAAAILLGAADSGPEILSSFSHLFDDSEDIMGWDLAETGLRVRFSRDIPSLIRANIPGLFEQACKTWGVPP
ncbi:MAG: stilbene synthase, partial [Spirochaetia bacterium]|nr:stilbene synthase [Spirochaetia bacterium]